jgi:hypothetical protein
MKAPSMSSDRPLGMWLRSTTRRLPAFGVAGLLSVIALSSSLVFATSSSATQSGSGGVKSAATSDYAVTMTTSANPGLTASPVTFTATVTNTQDPSTPVEGSVEFSDSTAAVSGQIGCVQGEASSEPLVDGVATCTIEAPTATVQPVVARYGLCNRYRE